jgi:hypothetical protein
MNGFNRTTIRFAVLAIVVFAYFVAFPDDTATVLAPVQGVLSLTQAVSPWFYVLLGFVVVAWTIVRIWGRRESRSAP